jgi:putative ABC transport system substrate-binding protein
VKRRLVLSGMAGLPLAAHAQAVEKPRIGFVTVGTSAVTGSRIEAMSSGLRVHGYTAQQLEIIVRTTEGNPSAVPAMIREVMEKKADLLFAPGPVVLQAAMAATRTVPIVAVDLETDPVLSGAAATLARPGGNVTGVFLDFPDFAGKLIELLRDCVPSLSRIAVLWDPTTGPVQQEATQKAASLLGLKIELIEIRVPADFDGAVSAAAKAAAQAVIILSSPLVSNHLQRLADLALRSRLPAITLFPDFARTGGLMAYGPSLLGMFRHAGIFAGKVLRGTKPADLPIERPLKFELVLNRRTAEALGIAISSSMLLRADEVIE